MESYKVRKSQHFMQRGQSLVEMMLAIALAAFLLPVLIVGLTSARDGKAQEQQRLQATSYLQELQEAVRSEREQGWSLIATNGTYYPVVSGSGWNLNAGSQTLNGFTRQVAISDVYRNASGQIAASGTLDPSTKKFDGKVSWGAGFTRNSVTSSFYLTRWQGNTSWTQTTQADFDLGTKTNVSTTAGGDVQLASNGTVSWAAPTLVGSFNNASTVDANDVYVDGNYAFVVTNSSTTNFAIVNVTNPAAPALVTTMNYTGVNINAVWVDNNIAYIATNDNAREVIAIDVTNKSAPVQVGTYDLAGTADATDIVISGGYGWITRLTSTSPEFQLVRLDGTLFGSIDIADSVNRVTVVGDTAYLSTNLNSGALTIVNATNKSAPVVIGSYPILLNDGMDVAISGTQAVLVTTNNIIGPEVYILNIANPASISLTGSYEAGSNVTGVTLSGTTAVLSTDVTNKQFLTLNISNPASPIQLSSINLAANSNHLFVVGDTAYVASENDTRELAIIRGTTSAAYVTNGTFTSSIFDALTNVGFNYLTFTLNEPALTDVRLQVAINSDNATWSYVGPDGTATTYYSTSSAIPLSKVSGRYFRYQATLLGSGSSTPLLQDVSVNYSP